MIFYSLDDCPPEERTAPPKLNRPIYAANTYCRKHDLWYAVKCMECEDERSDDAEEDA